MLSGGTIPPRPPLLLGGLPVPPNPPAPPWGGLPVPAGRIVQYSVALEASTSRPSTSSSPLASRSRVACSPSSSSGVDRFCSSMTDAVTVLPRADVPFGVQGQAAQRAWRPPSRDDPGRALSEGTSGARRDPDPQHSGSVGRQVLGQRFYRLVRFLLGLDDHHAAISVPGQGDGAHPEVFEQRKIERRVVLQRGRGGGRHVR